MWFRNADIFMTSSPISYIPSVATLVLILIKSPYKDQNRKNGPYFYFWSLFSKNWSANGKFNKSGICLLYMIINHFWYY